MSQEEEEVEREGSGDDADAGNAVAPIPSLSREQMVDVMRSWISSLREADDLFGLDTQKLKMVHTRISMSLIIATTVLSVASGLQAGAEGNADLMDALKYGIMFLSFVSTGLSGYLKVYKFSERIATNELFMSRVREVKSELETAVFVESQVARLRAKDTVAIVPSRAAGSLAEAISGDISSSAPTVGRVLEAHPDKVHVVINCDLFERADCLENNFGNTGRVVTLSPRCVVRVRAPDEHAQMQELREMRDFFAIARRKVQAIQGCPPDIFPKDRASATQQQLEQEKDLLKVQKQRIPLLHRLHCLEEANDTIGDELFSLRSKDLDERFKRIGMVMKKGVPVMGPPEEGSRRV